jgi:hypothetical protein
MQVLKYLRETEFSQDLEVIVEEKNNNEPRSVYIQGPYMLASQPNQNNRIYDLTEMVNEVTRYDKEFIKQSRALGELNHPQESTDVSLDKACHMITKLEQKDNVFYGRSKILSTPAGVIVKQLLIDGVKLGCSSRALGSLIQEGKYNKVKNFHLIAVDLVHQPSYQSAILESITENRQYIIAEGGRIVELACDSLQCRLNAIPKKDVDTYMVESFAQFMKALRG